MIQIKLKGGIKYINKRRVNSINIMQSTLNCNIDSELNQLHEIIKISKIPAQQLIFYHLVTAALKP